MIILHAICTHAEQIGTQMNDLNLALFIEFHLYVTIYHISIIDVIFTCKSLEILDTILSLYQLQI